MYNSIQKIRSYLARPYRKTATVRFLFPSVLVAAVLASLAAVADVDVSYVRLAISDAVVEKGGRITVDVYAYAHVPVNAVDITLRFDADTVVVREVDRGQSVLTIWTEDPIVTENTVVLRGGTYRRGFVDEHKIASIDLETKQAGENTFTITDVLLLAGDGEGTPVAVAEAMDSSVDLYVYDTSSAAESIAVDTQVRVVTDIDNDGKVTLKDVSMFMSAWHSKSKVYDFNNDGKMTFRDFSIILAKFFF